MLPWLSHMFILIAHTNLVNFVKLSFILITRKKANQSKSKYYDEYDLAIQLGQNKCCRIKGGRVSLCLWQLAFPCRVLWKISFAKTFVNVAGIFFVLFGIRKHLHTALEKD